MAPNLSFKVKSCETCVITALAISALFDNVQISISVNDKLLGGDIYIYILKQALLLTTIIFALLKDFD